MYLHQKIRLQSHTVFVRAGNEANVLHACRRYDLDFNTPSTLLACTKFLSPEIKVISKLGLESLKCRVLSSCLCPLGECFVRYSPAPTRSRKTTLLQPNAKRVDQLGHKLYHLRGDLGVYNYEL